MGIEHHLLRLARIDSDKQHAAVAEPDVRHLHSGGRTVDHNNLVLQSNW